MNGERRKEGRVGSPDDLSRSLGLSVGHLALGSLVWVWVGSWRKAHAHGFVKGLHWHHILWVCLDRQRGRILCMHARAKTEKGRREGSQMEHTTVVRDANSSFSLLAEERKNKHENNEHARTHTHTRMYQWLSLVAWWWDQWRKRASCSGSCAALISTSRTSEAVHWWLAQQHHLSQQNEQKYNSSSNTMVQYYPPKHGHRYPHTTHTHVHTHTHTHTHTTWQTMFCCSVGRNNLSQSHELVYKNSWFNSQLATVYW